MINTSQSLLLAVGIFLFTPTVVFSFQDGVGQEEVILQLIDALNDKNIHTRRMAVERLAHKGPGAIQAIPALLQALSDEDATYREAVVQAIFRIDSDSDDVIVALIFMLDDQYRAVRHAAIQALSPQEKLSPRTVQLVGRSLQAGSSLKRKIILQLLEKNGPDVLSAVPGVVEVLKDEYESNAVRMSAAQILVKNKIHELEACTNLGYMLEHGTLEERLNAVDVLRSVSPDTSGLVQYLIGGLSDKNRSVVVKVSALLGRIGPDAQIAIPALQINLVGEKWVSTAALHALVAIGPASIPSFIDVLNDDNLEVRHLGIKGLQAIGDRSVPALIEALQHDRHTVRWMAADVLGDLDSTPKDVVPALIQTLKDEDADVRAKAARALATIGLDAMAAIPELILLLKDPVPKVRRGAAFAFRWIRSEASTAVPALIEAINDDDKWVRSDVIEALGAYGPQAEQAVLVLLDLLTSGKDDWIHRSKVSKALGQIGISALPQLIKLLQDDNVVVRNNVAIAIGIIGPAADKAIPALINTLKDENNTARLVGVRALGRIGPSAATALQALINLKDDDDFFVRRYAIEAIGMIDPDAAKVREALIYALSDKTVGVRYEALKSLSKSTNVDVNLVTSIMSGLEDSDSSVRSIAAYLLGNMGSKARAAIPALQKLQSDELVARNATEALKKIQANQ